MKKSLIITFSMVLTMACVNAAETVFDSMGNAKEVNLAPAVKTAATSTNAASTSSYTTNSIKEVKFTNAITNLDDAQVELRQELAEKTAKYNAAVAEKERATQNCKVLKAEINKINKNMKNIDKAKQSIGKNLEAKS